MIPFGKKAALWLLVLGFMALVGGCADSASSVTGGQDESQKEADAPASVELSGVAEGLLGGYWNLVTEKNVDCSYQFEKDGSVSYREGLMQTDSINQYRGTYTTENNRVLLVFTAKTQNEFPTQEIAPVSQMLEIEKIDEHSRQFTLNAGEALPDSRQRIGEPLVYSVPAASMAEVWDRFALVQSEWGLHQRLGPDSGQESVQIIPNQSWVIILDDTAADWAYVNYDGKLGWVSNAYLTDGYAIASEEGGSEVAPPVAEDTSAYLSDEEFVVLNGIRLGMTYEEALALLGDYDEAFFTDPEETVRSVIKDGCQFGFHVIGDNYPPESLPELKRDGTFYLNYISINEQAAAASVRGIGIGDSIESVLAKFPARDTQLRQWAYQMLYGLDEPGKPRAVLQYTTVLGAYRIWAATATQTLSIDFDRENKVRKIELMRVDVS